MRQGLAASLTMLGIGKCSSLYFTTKGLHRADDFLTRIAVRFDEFRQGAFAQSNQIVIH